MKKLVESALKAVVLASTITFFASICLAGETLKYTNKSIDFYGYMQGLKVGDTVTAYDPDGVLCGAFQVTQNGAYGFLHIYGDDDLTKEDEGACSNDKITFKVNGITVFPQGPDQPIWTKDGDRFNVNLSWEK